MKLTNLAISLAVASSLAGLAAAQSATMAGKPGLEDTCSITGKAIDVRRIELLRLANGYYGHRGYDADNKLVCASEWSLTPALNLQAAQILRDKGNDVAVIVDHVFPKPE